MDSAKVLSAGSPLAPEMMSKVGQLSKMASRNSRQSPSVLGHFRSPVVILKEGEAV
jgi:hypothetical protein